MIFVLRKLALSFSFSFCLLLAACSLEQGQGTDASVFSRDTTATSSGDTLSLPPGLREDANTGEQSATAASTASSSAHGLSGLKGLKGVKVEQLFSQNIRDEQKRFERLEGTVSDLYQDLNVLKPSIIRLVAIEKDIQALTDMLSQNLNGAQGAPPPAANVSLVEDAPLEPNSLPDISQDTPVLNAPSPAVPIAAPDAQEKGEAKKEQTITQPAIQPTSPPKDLLVLNELRVGDHQKFIRVVIDSNRRAEYSHAFNAENTMLEITIPAAKWGGALSKPYEAMPLLSSYEIKAEPDTNTIQIMLSFRKPVQITYENTLSKSSGATSRLILDFRAF